VPLDDDPDLYHLAERGQVEDAVHRLVERAGCLDDEVVQARLGRVDRDAGHDVGKADRRVAAGELRVGETAAVGQQVHREPGRHPLAVLQQAARRTPGHIREDILRSAAPYATPQHQGPRSALSSPRSPS
jgi:hypothetical protein